MRFFEVLREWFDYFVLRTVFASRYHSRQLLPKPRTLIALDFDHTVVDDNTDTVVARILPPTQIPEHVRQLSKGDWVGYMQAIFNLLHENQISPEAIRHRICSIPPTPGLLQFITQMGGGHSDVDVIIISDSNTVFINTWLVRHGLERHITAIFTNPANFPESGGPLTVRPFHHQTECSLCPANLCKGKVLRDYIEASAYSYTHCIYIGDGRNDLCPILRLSKEDLACARVDYSCAKLLQGEYGKQVKAPVLLWKSGSELLERALSLMEPEK